MSSPADAIAIYLAAQVDGGGQPIYGTLGADTQMGILVGRSLGTPDDLISIYEYTGQPPVETMQAQIDAIGLPGIQIKVRSGRDKYDVARNRAIAIRDLLGALPDGTYSNVHILCIQAQGSILDLGTDDLESRSIESGGQ